MRLQTGHVGFTGGDKGKHARRQMDADRMLGLFGVEDKVALVIAQAFFFIAAKS